jgi:hypothetical protein
MKCIALIICFSLAAIASGAEVPGLVAKGFKKEYPHAKHIAWNIANGKFSVSFESGRKKYYADYDSQGHALGHTLYVEKLRPPRGFHRKPERDFL